MPRHIALLRAVNVAGTGRLPMAELRAMALALGFGNPQTLLASDWGSYITGAIIPVDGGLGLTGPRDFSAAAQALRRDRT